LHQCIDDKRRNTAMNWRVNWGERERVNDALMATAADPAATDEAMMTLVAEYLTACAPPYYLSISHDVRPSAVRRRALMLKRLPTYKGQPWGPCLVRCDWHHKNIAGIKERDREVAMRWAIDAMKLGYEVFYTHRISCWGTSPGSLAHIREKARSQQDGVEANDGR
jgi:hypothetical protein